MLSSRPGATVRVGPKGETHPSASGGRMLDAYNWKDRKKKGRKQEVKASYLPSS